MVGSSSSLHCYGKKQCIPLCAMQTVTQGNAQASQANPSATAKHFQGCCSHWGSVTAVLWKTQQTAEYSCARQPRKHTKSKPGKLGWLKLEDLIRAPNCLKALEFYSYLLVNLLLLFKRKIHDLKCQEVVFNFLQTF